MKLELEKDDYTLITALILVGGITLCFSKWIDHKQTLEMRRLAITEGGLLGEIKEPIPYLEKKK